MIFWSKNSLLPLTTKRYVKWGEFEQKEFHFSMQISLWVGSSETPLWIQIYFIWNRRDFLSIQKRGINPQIGSWKYTLDLSLFLMESPFLQFLGNDSKEAVEWGELHTLPSAECFSDKYFYWLFYKLQKIFSPEAEKKINGLHYSKTKNPTHPAHNKISKYTCLTSRAHLWEWIQFLASIILQR